MKSIVFHQVLLTTLLFLQSCGSGVKDRTFSSSSSTKNSGSNELTLTPSEIEALAESKIATEIQLLYIEDYYSEAKFKFPKNNFAKLTDFLLVNCMDSTSTTTVNNFKAYGQLLHNSNSEDHVINLIDDLALQFNSDQQSILSANQLAILLKAIEKTGKYRADIMTHAIKCLNVKVKKLEVDPNPVDPLPDDN